MISKKFTFVFILCFFLNNCGFKIVNYSKLNDFKIEEITSIGESKINYKLKNHLKVISNDSGSKIISINLNSKSDTSIKEKNISNEITKYKIDIITKIKYRVLNNGETGDFEFKISGDYLVDQKYSQTIKNEVQLVENLTQELSVKIKRELSKRLNDL